MPFFLKTRTINELRIYLNSLPLEQLVKLNRSYGPHFEELSRREDRTKAHLELLQQKLTLQQQIYQDLLIEQPIAKAEEQEWLKRRELLDEGGSRTERFLLKRHLGDSPLAIYNLNVLSQQCAISNLTQQIHAAESQNEAVKNDFILTVQELKILNGIIEAREQTLKADPGYFDYAKGSCPP